MTWSLPIQLALSVGIALAFLLLLVTMRRLVTAYWAVFWGLRMLVGAVAVSLIADFTASGGAVGPDPMVILLTVGCFVGSQAALLAAIWAHAAPTRRWARWRTLVLVLSMVLPSAGVAAHWVAPAMSLPIAILFARATAIGPDLLGAAVLWNARDRIDRRGALFLAGGLLLFALANAAGVIDIWPELGSLRAFDIAPATAAIQFVSTMVMTVAALYVVLTQERDVLHALAEDAEHTRFLESLGRLASGAAHDFNNVLVAVQLTAEMVRESDSPAERQEEAGYLGTAIDRGQSLVDRMHSYARREAISSELIEVATEITSMAPVLRRLLHERHTLVMDLATEPLYMQVDRDQFDRVLDNLVANARDAMPNGGQIVVRTVRLPDDRVEVSVRDDGIGMSAEVQARVFEPFFTTKEPGRGTGLGLSLCQSFAAQCGGAVDIISAPGAGTTVRLLIPTGPRPVPA